jgi:4-oxalocrotonate tautomerase
MAIVRIEMFSGRSREQKAAAAKAITEIMIKTLGTTSAGTQIIFVDVKKSDWAHDGKLSDQG